MDKDHSLFFLSLKANAIVSRDTQIRTIIAHCLGYSARSLRRYQERLKIGGLSALARPEGRPSEVQLKTSSNF
jgi:hypothetical protein